MGDATSLYSQTQTVRDAASSAVLRLMESCPALKADSALVREATALLASEIPADRKIADGPCQGPALTGLEGTPIEMAVRFGREKPKLRWLLDAEPTTPLPDETMEAVHHRWDAGLRIAHRLRDQGGADTTALERIWQEVKPTELCSQFMCYGVGIINGAPLFQNYIFSGVRPHIERACDLLGIGKSFHDKVIEAVGEDFSSYVAHELTKDGRAKLYVRLPDFDPARIQRLARLAGNFAPFQDFGEVLERLYGEVPRPRSAGGLQLCFHFRRGELMASTVHFTCRFDDFDLQDESILTDGELNRRIVKLLEHLGLGPEPYADTIGAFAVADLDLEVGIQTFISFIRDAQGLQCTSYLSPRFYLRPFMLRA